MTTQQQKADIRSFGGFSGRQKRWARGVWAGLLASLLLGAPAAAAADANGQMLRCSHQGMCTQEDTLTRLGGACRLGDEEIRFDVFAHHPEDAQDMATLGWQDWCAQITDQDGVSVFAVYSDEACLDAWIPDWHERLHGGTLVGLPISRRHQDSVLLDCLGAFMDISAEKSAQPAWMVLRALSHATLLTAMDAEP